MKMERKINMNESMQEQDLPKWHAPELTVFDASNAETGGGVNPDGTPSAATHS
jgi:hypothetical protein